MDKHSYHYIVTFNDLSDAKKEEILEDIQKRLRESPQFRELLLGVASDSFDLGKIEPERSQEVTRAISEEFAFKTWVEWEVVSNY